MGEVFKAEDVRLGRFVALKFLPQQIWQDSQATARFRLEARAASALNHPNICTVYDVGESSSRTYIAMEFLEGRSLRQQLRRGGLPPATQLKLAIQLAEALEAAHAKHIVHRDIKPENLFIVGQDRLKVLDFGIAKLRRGSGAQVRPDDTTRAAEHFVTAPGILIGTAAYMSPEQARGHEVDSRSDLFSFGAVLFEMAARREAFSGATPADVYGAVLSAKPTLPAFVGPAEFRERLQAIIDKALEKRPEFRYQHASDLAADLRRLERDLEHAPAAAIAPGRASSNPRQSLGRSVAGDLARAAVLTGLALMAHNSLEHRSSGRYLTQFQLALLEEGMEHGPLDESDFEAGGRQLPLIVDVSALHPNKMQPTDRTSLNIVIDQLRRHGARAIGIDLSFDKLDATDFQYFQKWVSHRNVRIGIYQRALERREAWLGRPEFAPLAAGIALPPDNPQHAFAYIRRWFPDAPPGDEAPTVAQDCGGPEVSTRCKEDLVQLPVALWLMSTTPPLASEAPEPNDDVESRLGRLQTAQYDPSERPLGNAVEFGTYVIDYSYLRDLRRDVIKLPPLSGADPGVTIVSYLDAHAASIADRTVLVGDLEDTSDQVCYTPGMRPLPGVLVHACSLATLNRGMLLEPSGTISRAAVWTLSLLVVAVIVALRVSHALWPRLRRWRQQDLEIVVFVPLSLGALLAFRWLAASSGVVWPNFLWFAGGLASYPFAASAIRAFIAAPGIVRAAASSVDGRVRGG
jgi:serine/threonine protein kinase